MNKGYRYLDLTAGTVKSITECTDGSATGVPQQCSKVLITVEGTEGTPSVNDIAVRFRADNGNPDAASVGSPMNFGEKLLFNGDLILKFIEADTDVRLHFEFFS